MTSAINHALEYLDMGLSIIPIRQTNKKPLIKWREYADRQPTEQEVIDWWTKWPDAHIAVITGAVSGVVVVDCDNDDAMQVAIEEHMVSPISVKTKRGRHYYFKHPRNGEYLKNKAGMHTTDPWPKCRGLDFRGDHGYAILPPSEGYAWDLGGWADFDDDMPPWVEYVSQSAPQKGGWNFCDLDLSDVKVSASDFISEWDATAQYREDYLEGRKIPTGQSNARNPRVTRYTGECVVEGYFADELRKRVYAFMNEHFVEPLPDQELEATIRSIEQAERRNHPERFDEHGNYIFHPAHKEVARHSTEELEDHPNLITMADAQDLIDRAEGTEYLIEPWLKRGTITQIHGYSGHGKSMFLQHMLAALASGARYMGPFAVNGPAKVLYFDFEMGMGTIGARLLDMKSAWGDTGDNLSIWTPFVANEEINLGTNEGLMAAQSWIKHTEPDIVVVDTVRSAWPGLGENSAEDWAKINQFAVKLRNAGIAIILLHHSNKPSSEGGLGREAGSTNQLTVLETQIRVTQVYKDKTIAAQKAALYDGDYEQPIWPLLEAKVPEDQRLYMVNEITYGKVRDFTDMHDPIQWVGYVSGQEPHETHVIGSLSSKQRAKKMLLKGEDPSEIAAKLGKPGYVIRDWLGIAKETT